MKAYTYIFLLFISAPLAASPEDKVYETARSALSEHKYNEALIHVKNILKTSPEHLAAHILLAQILLANGSASAAEVALTKAATLGANKEQLRLLFAQSYIMQGQYNKTLDYLPEHTNDNQLAAKIYVLRGDAHLGLRQLRLSQNDYKTALAFDDKNIDAKLGLAQIAVNYFKFRQADELVDEVLAGYIPPIKAWNLKASIQQSLGHNDLALKAVNQALLIDKNNIQSLIIASTINMELQQFTLVEQYVDSVLTQVPNEPRAEFIKAMAQLRTNKNADVDSLIVEVAQVLENLNEDTLQSNPSYYYLASIILFHQQKYLAAKQYIDNYLLIDENNINALILAATIDLIEKKPLSAKSLLNKANFLEPNNPKILSMLGMSYLALKQYENAHFHLTKAKEYAPNLGIVDTQLAQSYLAAGMPEKAIEHLLTASAAEYDPTIVALLLVESYVKSGEINKGLSVAKKLAENTPDNANIQHHLGYIYQISGNVDKARQQFSQALAIEPNHIKSIISLANLDYQQGKAEVAVNRLTLALKTSTNDIDLLIALAQLYNRSNNSAASVALLAEHFTLDHKNEALLKSLVVSYVGNKQLITAIETLNTYLLNQSKTVELHLMLASLQLMNSDLIAAIHAYNAAIKQGGNKADIYLLMAHAYQQFSKVPEAVNAYTKAMAWDENNNEAVIGLAQLYNAENETTNAIKLIKAFEVKHPLSAQLVEVLADSYLRINQYDLAEVYYKKRLNLASNDSSVVGLNLIYRATKRTEQAISLLTKSISNRPNSLLLNLALAEIYIEQSQWLSADELYQTLVKRYPNQPAILNNASYVALNLPDYQRAKALAIRSLALVDNQPDSLDTLGWIYYHTKEFNTALPLFRKALAIDNSNPAVKYHLALTLKALNRDKEAIKLMVDVVNSDFPQKADADILLQQWLSN